jgi:hypothetical protein
MGLWVYGSMGLWVYGSMGLWVYGSMGLWVYGSMSLGASASLHVYAHRRAEASAIIVTMVMEKGCHSVRYCNSSHALYSAFRLHSLGHVKGVISVYVSLAYTVHVTFLDIKAAYALRNVSCNKGMSFACCNVTHVHCATDIFSLLPLAPRLEFCSCEPWRQRNGTAGTGLELALQGQCNACPRNSKW